MAGKTVKKFSCRYEELPVIGSFLRTNLERDKTDFLNYSPDYNDEFIANYTSKLNEVEEIVNPKNLIDEVKVITSKIANLMSSTRDLLNKLEGYVKRATGLKIKPEDFGIKAVREKISVRDVDDVGSTVKIVLKNSDDNIAALKQRKVTLKERGFPANIKHSLKTASAVAHKQYEGNEVRKILFLKIWET